MVMSRHDAEREFGIDLRPCPFCESPNVGLYLGPTPHVTCMRCQADGPAFESRREEDLQVRRAKAMQAWNMRST
jgi:hypothetical protein